MSSLAEKPGLITRLFDVQQVNSHGVYSIWLNKEGAWNEYLVDSYFPVDSKTKKPVFCSTN